MAALAINKRELFAQALADNMNQEQAYIAAGFNSTKNAKTNASHLLKKDKSIKKRVAEIRNEKSTMQVRAGTLPTVKAFESLRVGKDTICEHLWDIAMQAKAAVPVLNPAGDPIGIYNANWNSSIKALELLGKEMGMFLPKDELPANEYANKSTKDIVQELVDKCAKMGIKIQVPVMQGETITIE
jgi:hypothetical protein